MGLKVSFIDAFLLLLTLFFILFSGLLFLSFALLHFYRRILVWFLSFARSANYGDDMDEFNGMGRGRGRYYQVAWALKKMNMLSCAVSVLYCVLSRFHVIFCVC